MILIPLSDDPPLERRLFASTVFCFSKEVLLYDLKIERLTFFGFRRGIKGKK